MKIVNCQNNLNKIQIKIIYTKYFANKLELDTFNQKVISAVIVQNIKMPMFSLQ